MKIVIPGDPVPQARMKYSNRNGFVTTYDPKAKEKKEIRQILEVYKTNVFYDYPRVSFLFCMPIPSSVLVREKEMYRSGSLKHDKKPDVDNLVKLYLDCLDGIILNGDQKVSLGPCVKVYSTDPKTMIWIQNTARIISPWELDFVSLDALEHDKQYSCQPDYHPD